MHDVAPELLELIQKDFEENYNKRKLIASLYQKVRDGTATYLEANDYAIEVGKLLSDAYQRNLSSAVLPDGHMYYNIAKRVIYPTMEHNHELISSMANMVQSDLNELNGFGIKALIPEINLDRITGIIEKVVSVEQFDDVKWVLGESVVNFSQNVVAETIKTNAEFHYNMGVEGKIIRETSGGCCEWCNRLAGTYVYPDVPQDVYRRHDYCRCTVDYELKGARSNVHNNRTGKRQYIKDKYGNYVLSKDERIKHAKKMAATEQQRKESARRKRINTWAEKKKKKNYIVENTPKNSIIKVSRSVGAAGKNYPVKMLDSKQHTKLAEGQRIEGSTFAGYGTDREIRDRFRLERDYGISADKWEKVGGKGYVIVDGKSILAELHWYEAEGEIVEMKVKRYLDES